MSVVTVFYFQCLVCLCYHAVTVINPINNHNRKPIYTQYILYMQYIYGKKHIC